MSAWYIKTRAEFFEVLDRALAETKRRRAASPNFPPYQMIERQLEAMKQWTASGRPPTPDEQKMINIGLIAVREIDPQVDAANQRYHDDLVQLDGYFMEWPPDPPGGP